MRARRRDPRARAGVSAMAAIQILTLVLVVGVAAYAAGTLWPSTTPAPAGSAQPSAGSSPTTTTASGSANAVPAGPADRGYRKVEIGSIAYGREDDRVGLSVQKESRPRGPSSLAVAADGTIYVADDANARVQAYDSSGKHVKSIDVGEPIRDLTVGLGDDLLLLTSRAELFHLDRATGQTRGRWALEGAPAKGLGTLRSSAGSLAVESPEQVTYPIATGSGSTLAVLPSAEQERQSRKGGKSALGDFYSTSYRDGGHLYRLDDQGNVVHDFALGLTNVLSVVFLDEDKVGNAYAQVESRDGGGVVVVEVWRFGKGGGPKTVVPIEPVTYVAMVRSVVVAEDGSIYEAIPSKDSMRLVKWVAQ